MIFFSLYGSGGRGRGRRRVRGRGLVSIIINVIRRWGRKGVIHYNVGHLITVTVLVWDWISDDDNGDGYISDGDESVCVSGGNTCDIIILSNFDIVYYILLLYNLKK